MGKQQTVQAIKDQVLQSGTAVVPQALVEYFLDTTFADDDEYEDAVNQFVQQKSWLDSARFSWSDPHRMVILHGPQAEVPL